MKKTYAITLGASILFSGAASVAQTAERPTLKVGDTWTYRNTIEVGPSGWKQSRDDLSVTRTTASSIYISAHESGSTQPPRELFLTADWGRVRDVNGKETLVNQPLNFPLTAGKTWTVEFHEDHPNKVHRYEEWNIRYTVIGVEKVTVPAGTFDAIKVEGEGQWKAETEPTNTVVQGAQLSSGTTSMATQVNRAAAKQFEGRIFKATWYVPEVRRWVKSVEELYSAGGVRSERQTAELEAFKPGE